MTEPTHLPGGDPIGRAGNGMGGGHRTTTGTNSWLSEARRAVLSASELLSPVMTAQGPRNRSESLYARPFPWLSTRAKLLVVLAFTLVLTAGFVWVSDRIADQLERCRCDRPAAEVVDH